MNRSITVIAENLAVVLGSDPVANRTLLYCVRHRNDGKVGIQERREGLIIDLFLLWNSLLNAYFRDIQNVLPKGRKQILVPDILGQRRESLSL